MVRPLRLRLLWCPLASTGLTGYLPPPTARTWTAWRAVVVYTLSVFLDNVDLYITRALTVRPDLSGTPDGSPCNAGAFADGAPGSGIEVVAGPTRDTPMASGPAGRCGPSR